MSYPASLIWTRGTDGMREELRWGKDREVKPKKWQFRHTAYAVRCTVPRGSLNILLLRCG